MASAKLLAGSLDSDFLADLEAKSSPLAPVMKKIKGY
jgi:hypothetical protein